MLSTRNLDSLLAIDPLKARCKTIGVVDTIVSGASNFQTYTYHPNWAAGKEVFERNNQQGDRLFILFNQAGAIINGFDHESNMADWRSNLTAQEWELLRNPKVSFEEKKQLRTKNTYTQHIYKGVVDSVPEVFRPFIFSPPISEIGTTFCIWKTPTDDAWQIGDIDFPSNTTEIIQGETTRSIEVPIDGSENLLRFMDGDLEAYRKWLSEYYDDIFTDTEMDMDFILKVENNTPISKEMVLTFHPLMTDYRPLIKALEELGYPHTLVPL